MVLLSEYRYRIWIYCKFYVIFYSILRWKRTEFCLGSALKEIKRSRKELRMPTVVNLLLEIFEIIENLKYCIKLKIKFRKAC